MNAVNITKDKVPVSNTRHISGLDGLRTLAITGVTLFHMFPQAVCGGYLGVSLFFLLTGYLLAYTTEYSRIEGRFSITAYYIKRILRIYPALILVVLTTIGVYSFLAPNVIAAIRSEVISIVLGYNNWWQIAQNSDYFTRIANQSPFTHLWFLGIELQYYLLWPLFFLIYAGIAKIYGTKAGVVFTLVCAIVSAAYMPLLYQPGMDVTRLYYGTDTRVYALLLGAAMGLHQAHFKFKMPGRPWNPVLKFIIFIILMIVTIVSYFTMDGQSSFTYQGGMFGMTLVFAAILLLTIDYDLKIGTLFESALPRWIGKRSYSIFLWQYPVIFLVQYLQWNDPDTLSAVGIPAELAPAVPLVEIIAILLLSAWSDLLLAWLSALPHLSLSSRRVIAQLVFVFIIALPILTMMGFGAKGVIMSADSREAVAAELKAQMERNQEALNAQNAQSLDAAQPPAAVQQVDLNGIACIGDSVMLGSAMELKQALPNCYIDAQTSRYVGAGVEVAQSMAAQNRLGNIVLIALGTNGPLKFSGRPAYEQQTQALLQYLGPDRHIFWVNSYCPATGWQEINNDYLQELQKQYPNLTVIDWCGLVSQHPDWLVGDGIHPNEEGAKQYANLIRETMIKTLQQTQQSGQ